MTLRDGLKKLPADQLDYIISAELPDKNTDPEYYEAVTKYMLHGKCGAINPSCACMRPNDRTKQPECRNHYPRPFRAQTTWGKEGYPLYRRRYDGRTHTATRDDILMTFDNGDVVPHNRFLLLKFDAHINVEIASNISCVKYIYKYIYKGEDRATAKITEVAIDGLSNADACRTDAARRESSSCGSRRAPPQQAPGAAQRTKRVYDEIEHYVSGRWVSSSAACWRIFSFDTHYNYPSVMKLLVHTKNSERVYFTENFTKDQMLNAQARRTTLTAWFELNERDPHARQFLYQDIPEYYTFNQSTRRWTIRKRGEMLGRMCTAYPRQGERFYMRLILTKKAGCRSYDDLYEYNGHRYGTYRECALAYGLLTTDSEITDALKEALHTAIGPQQCQAVRHMFGMYLLYADAVDTLHLWEANWGYLCEEYMREEQLKRKDTSLTWSQVDNTIQQRWQNRALIDIDAYLRAAGIADGLSG